MNRIKLAGTSLFAVAGAITISIWTSGIRTAPFEPPANAAEKPRVIEIKAKRFEFSAPEITLKKGEPVILRLISEDRKHGFLLKPLNIDTDILPDKATDIAVTPGTAGVFTVICDHYCGTGHGNMKMKVIVVE